MPPTHIRVVARFTAKAGCVDEVKAILSDFVDPTRAEKGCVSYEILQNVSDPRDLTFVEEWKSDEDLQNHLQSAHLAEGRERLKDKLETSADVRKYHLVK